MKDIFYTIIYAVLEGITEWMPISSTAHILLLNNVIKMNVSDAFMNIFLILIQFGAIMAVFLSFFKKIWPLKIEDGKIYMDQEILKLWLKIILACIPISIVGLLLDKYINKYLYNTYTISITLIIYGIIFILVEFFYKKKNKLKSGISYKLAFIIGLSEVLSLIPGTSRSGITIITAMLFSIKRNEAFEFSFLISIPVMILASGYKTFDFYLAKNNLELNEIVLLSIGVLMSFLVSLITIRFINKIINKHDFKIFGIYRIILGIILLFMLKCR